MPISPQIVSVPFARLTLWPGNPRRRVDEGGLRELADDLASRGVLQNLIGRPAGIATEIVSGQRRLRAAARLVAAGTWSPDYELPVRIAELDDDEALRIAVAENVQRESMSPFEEGEAINRLRRAGDTVESIAVRLARSDRWVREREGLYLRAGRETHEAFDEGLLNLGQAGALIIGEPDRQVAIVTRIAQGESWDAPRIRTEMRAGLPALADARFDPALYQGPLRRDLFHDHSYAEDRDEFARLQEEAAEAIAERHRAVFAWAVVQKGGAFDRSGYKPEDGPPETAGVVVHLRADLKIREYTGLVKRPVLVPAPRGAPPAAPDVRPLRAAAPLVHRAAEAPRGDRHAPLRRALAGAFAPEPPPSPALLDRLVGAVLGYLDRGEAAE
jgi:ParB/RepB/Spo0J family partition protein